MPMPRLAVLALLLLAASGGAQAMRCDGRIISTGDRDVQVRARCGAPAWSDRYSEWLLSGVDGPMERRVERVHERWVYNFGPTNLVQHLHFVDGRLEQVESGGYGVRVIGEDCSNVALSRGSSPADVYLRCGEPASRNSRYEDLIQRDGMGNARIRPVRREEWIYPADGSGAWRRLQFVDGRLDSEERLSH